ncbi:hypothetical protein B0H17DRAFT_1200597 [Mycena rosella]|uniref:Uncharacterized protein n=1 Tax=Mycena rosella TaxID=1033263 RepID=A0AAD7GIC7_MYCRO|nr:hypothetical protein B0H17DRAFT_1200597 [Mycena rosella]
MEELQKALKEDQAKTCGSGVPLAEFLVRSSDGIENAAVPLGAIGAMITIEGTEYLVTTNADYIPALPTTASHDIYLRKDLCYGPDDHTVWPQQYSERYCHLAVIRTPQGLADDCKVYFFEPRSQDFVKQQGPTLTAALGRLHSARLSQFATAVDDLLDSYKFYIKEHPGNLPPPLNPLVNSMSAALKRLEIVPATQEQAFLAVRNLQRTLLELDALLTYMMKCVGAYTGNAAIAQSLSKAGLPYWYIHPAGHYPDGNITLVLLRSAESHLELAPHPQYTTISKTTYSTDVKIEAIHKVSHTVQWYKDPFQNPDTSAASSSPQAATPASSSTASSSQRGSPSKEQCYHPYKSSAAPKAPSQPNPAAGRDKFTMLDRPEMPPPAGLWATALQAVDETRGAMCQLAKTDTYYIMPEPALFAAPENPQIRQLRLHHFTMLWEALLYRLGDSRARCLMSSQEWRDILSGTMGRPARANSKRQERTRGIDEMIGPALRACGLNQYRDFPARPEDVPPITLH